MIFCSVINNQLKWKVIAACLFFGQYVEFLVFNLVVDKVTNGYLMVRLGAKTNPLNNILRFYCDMVVKYA
jgi:hypothetical protein